MKNRFLSLLFLLSCLVLLFVGLGTQTPVFGQNKKALDVPYCDLVTQSGKYAGKFVRLRAVIISGRHREYLVDPRCNETAEPIFACSGEPKCDKALKRMYTNTDGNGDYFRVEAILVGELEISPATSSSTSTPMPIFRVREIENSFKIPRKIPFPYY